MKFQAQALLFVMALPFFVRAENQDTPKGEAKPSPIQVSTGSTNRVEPLSSPLKLTMTAKEVLAQFGTPKSDYRFYGGGLTYPDFRILFNATGTEIGTLVIRNQIRLACGLGVGDSMEKVRQFFPNGRTVYDTYQVETGQYALTFTTYERQVSEITIRPAQQRFVEPDPSKRPERTQLSPTLKTVAGLWLDPKNGQSLELFTDGSYRTGVGGSGKFTIQGEHLIFSGVLSAWDQGKATMSQSNVIEFYWTNSDGSKNYFAFLRSPSKGSD